MRKDRARENRKLQMYTAQSLGDTMAAEMPGLYPGWNSNSFPYKADYIVRHGDGLYRCLQDHTSQADWAPGAAPSLWVAISDPAVEWPDWVQPTGAHDAYALGAKVTHNSSRWTSDVDANVWEPGVYGWTEAAE